MLITPEELETILRRLQIIEEQARLIQEDPRSHAMTAHKAKTIRLDVLEIQQIFQTRAVIEEGKQDGSKPRD